MRFQSSEIPQANRLDLVLKIVDSTGSEGITTSEIVALLESSTNSKYTPRQALYYGDAGAILGLLVRNENNYVLSRLGKRYALSISSSTKSQYLREALQENKLISSLHKHLEKNGFSKDDQREIAKWISQHSGLANSTSLRRASTLSRYLEYI